MNGKTEPNPKMSIGTNSNLLINILTGYLLWDLIGKTIKSCGQWHRRSWTANSDPAAFLSWIVINILLKSPKTWRFKDINDIKACFMKNIIFEQV